MSKDTKLNLAVIGVKENVTVGSGKEFSHISAKLRADGNVLHIWLCGRNSARLGLGLLENGVNTSVLGDDL